MSPLFFWKSYSTFHIEINSCLILHIPFLHVSLISFVILWTLYIFLSFLSRCVIMKAFKHTEELKELYWITHICIYMLSHKFYCNVWWVLTKVYTCVIPTLSKYRILPSLNKVLSYPFQSVLLKSTTVLIFFTIG